MDLAFNFISRLSRREDASSGREIPPFLSGVIDVSQADELRTLWTLVAPEHPFPGVKYVDGRGTGGVWLKFGWRVSASASAAPLFSRSAAFLAHDAAVTGGNDGGTMPATGSAARTSRATGPSAARRWRSFTSAQTT